MTGRTALMGLAIVPAFMVSCGTRTIDSQEAQRRIASGIEHATGVHVTVSCPDNVPASKGRVTLCTATAPDGTRATARIVQTDQNGSVRYSSPVVHTAQLEQEMSGGLTGRLGFKVTVTCPDLVEATRGTKFQCKAADPAGHARVVNVTALTAHGGFHYDLGPPPANA